MSSCKKMFSLIVMQQWESMLIYSIMKAITVMTVINFIAVLSIILSSGIV